MWILLKVSTLIIPRATGGGKTSSGMPTVTRTNPQNTKDFLGAGRNFRFFLI
jgi:hypothetical protein